MPAIIARGKHHRQVRFPTSSQGDKRRTSSLASITATSKQKDSADPEVLRALPQGLNKLKRHSISLQDIDARFPVSASGCRRIDNMNVQAHSGVPTLFTERLAIRDSLITETTKIQDETVEQCLPLLKGVQDGQYGPFNEHGIPALQRDNHISYLCESLEEYPSDWVMLDASRPWMVYWALAGLCILGEDVTKYRARVVNTFKSMQNPTGGFGGGHGQTSHCASTYAAILSLSLVGGNEAFQLVDRKAMWKWLGNLKQPDGGFRLCDGGEEDVRGAYCAMVVISLLDLPLALPPDAEARRHGIDTFVSGLPEYLSRCQTYEGGISGSPGTEAHGAYAFCALACLSIVGEPDQTIPRYIDVPLLISWLSARQYAPEGGFAGRTNKLVDGCYSHWVGGCWPLIQAALNGKQSASAPNLAIGSLYSREGLTRYILSCCQNDEGGLRDKPGKHVDSYHTCYTLTGLSVTQYHHYHTDSNSKLGGVFSSAFSWKYLPIQANDEWETDPNVFNENDRLMAFHPLFVISHTAAENMRTMSESSPLELA